MKSNKENAIKNFLETIEQSWTRERLTDDEKTQFLDFLNYSQMTRDAVKGTYENRLIILNALYFAFLKGCGYRSGVAFRQEKEL